MIFEFSSLMIHFINANGCTFMPKTHFLKKIFPSGLLLRPYLVHEIKHCNHFALNEHFFKKNCDSLCVWVAGVRALKALRTCNNAWVFELSKIDFKPFEA